MEACLRGGRGLHLSIPVDAQIVVDVSHRKEELWSFAKADRSERVMLSGGEGLVMWAHKPQARMDTKNRPLRYIIDAGYHSFTHHPPLPSYHFHHRHRQRLSLLPLTLPRS